MAKNKEVILDPLFNNPIAAGARNLLRTGGHHQARDIHHDVLAVPVVGLQCRSRGHRTHIPPSIRIIVQLTIIASLVIVTDQI